MSIPALLIQVAITLLVVALYHLWVSRKKRPAPTPAVVAAPVAAPPKTSPAGEPIPPEILAVISAAVGVVLGRPHRVASVQPAAEASIWVFEGRMEQFMSHKIR